MVTRRTALKTLIALGATASLGTEALAAKPALTWMAFPADASGFNRAPVLLTAGDEAILIDGGFTLADGRALAAAIKATGKKLTTILVTQKDPDYYFSLGPVKAAFPAARVVSTAEIVAGINGNVSKKLAVWGPQLKENGPQTLADVVIPEATDARSFTVGGHPIELIAEPGHPHSTYVWVPSLKAAFGGVLVVADHHVWMADSPTPADRKAWVKSLDALAARKPKIVVAGHLLPSSKTDASAIAFTRAYLLAYEQEAAKAADSKALSAAMKARYPGLASEGSLDLGAKVVKGEMAWG
jgi:glyoxylase-like metal-dependent hydrolase (beta-lactamase superfamily II)